MTRKAIVNIFSSYNNVLLTATDLTGAETIAKCSGGQVVKSSKDFELLSTSKFFSFI